MQTEWNDEMIQDFLIRILFFLLEHWKQIEI